MKRSTLAEIIIALLTLLATLWTGIPAWNAFRQKTTSPPTGQTLPLGTETKSNRTETAKTTEHGPLKPHVPLALSMTYEELRSQFEAVESDLRSRLPESDAPKPEIISALSTCRKDLDAAGSALAAADTKSAEARLIRVRRTINYLKSL